MKKKLKKLIQGYLGMNPKDRQCADWNEMQSKCTDEIMTIASDDAIRFLEWTKENDWVPARSLSNTEWLWDNGDDWIRRMSSLELYSIYRKEFEKK